MFQVWFKNRRAKCRQQLQQQQQQQQQQTTPPKGSPRTTQQSSSQNGGSGANGGGNKLQSSGSVTASSRRSSPVSPPRGKEAPAPNSPLLTNTTSSYPRLGATPTGGSGASSALTTPSPPLTPGSSQLPPSSYPPAMNQIHPHGDYGFAWSSPSPGTVNPGQCYAGQTAYNAYQNHYGPSDYYHQTQISQISQMHHSPQSNYHHHHHPQYHHNMSLTSASMSHIGGNHHHLNPGPTGNDHHGVPTSSDYILPEQKYQAMV